MSHIIYCISGLGADEKIFVNLKLEGYTLKYIPWLRPLKNEHIESYAARMAKSIQHKDAVLIGVSFGGMVAIEIARQMPLKKLILISSVKTVDELPRWMKIISKLQLNKMIPARLLRHNETIGNYRLGVSNEEERKMVNAYRKSADPVYIEWSINQVISWKNKWQPADLAHIHGSKDRVFPVKRIRKAYLIKGGTHLMVFNRAEEISKIIMEELKQLTDRYNQPAHQHTPSFS